MLNRQQLTALAELVHLSMRGRQPASDTELEQAEQAAVHVADYFLKANWTPPEDDTITLTVDEATLLAEAAIAARTILADIIQALRTTPSDAALRELLESTTTTARTEENRDQA